MLVLPVGDVNPTRRRAVVTGLLLVANLGVHLGWQTRLAGCEQRAAVYRFAAVPREVVAFEPLSSDGLEALLGTCADAAGGKSVALSLLTAMFLHGNLGHLLGNLLFLWIFGNNVEDRLGRVRFLLFYLVGGAAATVAFALLHPGSTVPLLGASGAIAAVLGAYLVLFPRASVLTYVPFPLYLLAVVVPAARIRAFFLLFAVVSVPAWLMLGAWFGFQALAARSSLSSGVAYEAHVAGFVAGVLLLLLLGGRRRRPRRPGRDRLPGRGPTPR